MDESGDDPKSEIKNADNNELDTASGSCDVGNIAESDKSGRADVDDSGTHKERCSDCQVRNTDAEKENVEFNKSKHQKKRKYRLRSSKGDDLEDDEDSLMEQDDSKETSNNINNENNETSVTTTSKVAKITKKRKRSISKKFTASSKTDSTSEAQNKPGETSQSIEQSNTDLNSTVKNTANSSSDSDDSSFSSSTSSRPSSRSSRRESCSSSSDSSYISIPSFEDPLRSERIDHSKPELTDDEEWLSKDINPVGPPTWFAAKELYNRQYGCQNLFWQCKVRASRGLVSKLDQQYTLDGHQGCVNALHFNQTGSLLASGSDDLDINIWDFQSSDSKPFITYHSGHRSNVFQSKFMPNSNDLTVVSCARDGQVRVGFLSSTGTCKDTKKLAQHRGSAHKLALDRTGSNSIFFSCGEDGVVMEFDLRENNPSKKLVTVKERESKLALYAIDTSPRQPFQFAISGRDEWARIYDRRMLSSEDPEPYAKYCPSHLQLTSRIKANITCLVYNHDGRELLCSYNDEDIYLFDATHSSMDEFQKKFKGHRNSATVKGVNFYGPNSEYVVSGSDCGNIFLWDKASSQVVRFMEGDEGGVINVLEPHPNLPILATSGLDSNIKIWGPTGDGELDETKLKTLMLENHKDRYHETNEASIDSQLLWFLMRSLRLNPPAFHFMDGASSFIE